MLLQTQRHYVRQLCERGGPAPHEYDEVNEFITQFNRARAQGLITEDERKTFMAEFKGAFSLATVQGFIYLKPHGYAGDFEVIDRIYNQWCSPKAELKAWDTFFHNQSAPRAVRNRKAYFHDILNHLVSLNPHRTVRVLNIGSGPGRCIAEWLDCNPHAQIEIDCVDNDARAIAFATALTIRHVGRIRFRHENAMRLKGKQTYDLVWSAGLFDYFRDSTFVGITKRLTPFIAEGGQMIIGNFSDSNPTLPHMEFSDWHLHHRSPETLTKLMRQAGLSQVHIAEEPEGVNLFAHAAR